MSSWVRTPPVRPAPRPECAGPCTVLFLTADTGGGHRAATEAIGQALDSRYPGRFTAVARDPLTGPDAHRLLRRVCRWYGPLTRRAPWLWAIVFHLTDIPMTRWALRRSLSRLAVASITASLARHRPAVVVCTHPLVIDAAVAARRNSGHSPALVTVVTDLATAHGTWWNSRVDRTITPSARLSRAGRRAGAAGVHGPPLGIPVRERFRRRGSPGPADKAALRTSLGLRPGRFVVLVTAGGEGVRGLKAWTRTIVDLLPEVDVVTVCGRNESLRAELDGPAAAGGRLRVMGMVDNMSDWLRCADLVVSKAGPSIIAEATSLGVPLLLPAHLPGQEAGNTELAVAAGAARAVRGRRHLARRIEALRRDPAAMADMRAAAFRFGKPHAATRMAEAIAEEAWTDKTTEAPSMDAIPATYLRKEAR